MPFDKGNASAKPQPTVTKSRLEKTLSKATRFWGFSFEPVFEALLKKSRNDVKGLCLLLIII
jgi:hypothetical protein